MSSAEDSKLTAEMEAALPEFGLEGCYAVTEVTDFKATIRVFTPIDDHLKPTKFVSYVDIQYRGMPHTVPFSLPAEYLADARVIWKAEAIKAANAAIEQFEKEASRLQLLTPNGAPMTAPPFLKTRH